MNNFEFYSPTKVIFGKNAEKSTAKEIKKFGGTRVMVVYGGGSVVKNGLLGEIEHLLTEEHLEYTLLGGVKPNPRLSLARIGVTKALEFGADFILAVGGGSVIDTAKGIAHGVANPQTDIWSFWTKKVTLEKSMPVGVVLTISAAGSETSDSAVLTNEELGLKRGISTDFNRPKFAIMNPELTYTLPKYQIQCGIVDIMMHTLDRYFTNTKGNEMTDEIAESLLRNVIKNGRAALLNQNDYGAMSELMWCGSLSHNGLTGLGRVKDFSTHGLGHELSAKFDVAHGASLSAMWGSWAEYCCIVNPGRFARLGQKVWGINKESTEDMAHAAIEKTVSFFTSIDMPTCFSELGIGAQSEEVINELTDKCVEYGKRKVGNFKVLLRNDVYNIYKLANR